MNSLDTVFSATITKGRKATRYADIISQIYVVSKNRQAYDKDEGFLNPAAYFLFTTEQKNYGKSGVFGVTNLKINGKESNMDIVPYKRNQKPDAVKAENGTEIYDKQEKAVRADYYQLHTEGPDIIVDRHNDVIILQFDGDSWYITDFEQEVTEIDVDEEALLERYFALLEQTEGSKPEAIALLKEEYEWLPKNQVVLNEIEKQKADEEEWRSQYGL